jgi:hypothetical protein
MESNNMNERLNYNQPASAAILDGQQRRPQISDELSQVLQQQIRRWPLATFGAAIVAGYLLGRRETVPSAKHAARGMQATSWMTLGSAQMGSTSGVIDGQDTMRHAFGSAGNTGKEQASDTMAEHQGRVPSQAPNASFDSGAGSGTTGFDSPPVTSSYLSNTDVGGPDQGRPYFPPGGAPDRDRSGPEQGGDST